MSTDSPGTQPGGFGVPTAIATPPQGSGSPIPVVPTPKPTAWWQWRSAERDERKQLEKDGSQSHNIRRIAAYGGLLLVLALYGCGVVAIALFLGLLPGHDAAKPEYWHIVAIVLAALFTVPTVLLLAVLRAVAISKGDDSLPQSMHEALGQALMKVFDKLVDSK